MKNIGKIIFSAGMILLAALLLLSCSKEESAQADNAKGAITVSIDGELGEFLPADGTKSELSNPIRLSWEGAEKVYAFDGVKCLGALDVTLKEGKDYYALLSGELSAPSEGTTKVTLVHAPGFTAEKGADMTEGKLSFDLTSQSGAVATTPFVAYATMDYNGQTSIDNLVVNFTFATSIIRINCSGMEASKNFTTIISGMSNECVLEIDGDGVSVGTGTTGNISLASAKTNAQGTKMLYAGLARTASKTDVSVVTTQGSKSYEGAIVNGSAWAAKTAYNTICPVTEANYIVIAGLRWAKQNLAISPSGNMKWKGDNSSAVKVPGTDEDVIIGDYFQWAAYEGYAQVEGQTVEDEGLLIYTSFTNICCVDGGSSSAFAFKSGIQFSTGPYFTGSAYTKYNKSDRKKTLEASDDVANIILGGSWRMPTQAEFQAMRDATYWAWDAMDMGCYVFAPDAEHKAGSFAESIPEDLSKSDALLFFPAAGYGGDKQIYTPGGRGEYWSSSLRYDTNCYDSYALHFENVKVLTNKLSHRVYGYMVRPVKEFQIIIQVQ